VPIRLDGASRTLRLSSSSEREKAAFLQSLREGQTLQARVVDQGPDGKWTLRIQGRDLLADSRLPLEPGQWVSARVESAGPPVVLAILEDNAGEAGATLSRALKDLGLEDDVGGRAVLERMIARQLPLDRATVERLRDALARAGVDPTDRAGAGRTLDALLLLDSRSVPATSAGLAAAMAGTTPFELGGMLGGLLDMIRGLARDTKVPISADIREFERSLTDLLTSAEGLSEGDVRRMVRNLGLSLEGRLRALAEGAGSADDLADLTRGDLKAALLRLEAALRDPGRLAGSEAGERDLLAALGDRVGGAIRGLEHLQILNLPARHDPNPLLCLPIPLLFGGERVNGELRLFGEGRGAEGRIDPDHVRLVLRLDLAHLGPVTVDLRIEGRSVACRIGVAGEAQRKLFQEGQEGLKAGLSECGYTVGRIACEIGPEPESETGPAQEAAKIGLDVRA
jgi:hypothetical protein